MTTQVREFRKDINGLRAWAVVAVILFHFNVPGFSGGFVGVDIFFVISGYLMTGIIARGLQNKNFSFTSFYISRARRILPALIALCLALLIVAWFFLPPIELKNHANRTYSAISFISNISFMNEAGYFDSASHEKLLLHTWSLSVEWQFYLILPLILWAVWKLKPKSTALTISIIFVSIISFVCSIYLSSHSPASAFYLLHSRAWEMLAGGLVYLLANNITLSEFKRKILESLGFIIILFSILTINENTYWPGWRALAPVLGSVLILIAARRNSIWTSHYITQKLGSWSYSLYLWHWPIAAILIQTEMQNNIYAVCISLSLTLLLGWLSFNFIEKTTIKKLKNSNNIRSTLVLLIAIIVLAILTAYLRKNSKSSFRIPQNVVNIYEEGNHIEPSKNICTPSKLDPCQNTDNQLGVIVIGDSHAGSLLNSISNSLPNNNTYVLNWGKAACPTIKDSNKIDIQYNQCSSFIYSKLEQIKSIDEKKPIIIINRTSLYFFGDKLSKNFNLLSKNNLIKMRESLINTACEFAETHPVYMVRPIPEMKVNVPNAMGKALWHTGKYREVSITLEEYHTRHSFVWKAQDEAAERCGIKIINPLPYLCSKGKCKGNLNNLPIYMDNDHLNDRGGRLLIPLFKSILSEH